MGPKLEHVFEKHPYANPFVLYCLQQFAFGSPNVEDRLLSCFALHSCPWGVSCWPAVLLVPRKQGLSVLSIASICVQVLYSVFLSWHENRKDSFQYNSFQNISVCNIAEFLMVVCEVSVFLINSTLRTLWNSSYISKVHRLFWFVLLISFHLHLSLNFGVLQGLVPWITPLFWPILFKTVILSSLVADLHAGGSWVCVWWGPLPDLQTCVSNCLHDMSNKHPSLT